MALTISRARLEGLLEGAAGTRIVAIGDAMLDEYLVGDVDRISPEAPVPVVRVRERRFALGGVANVAQNVVAAGAECRLVCAIGSDAAGQQLGRMLAEIGVASDGVVTGSRPTTRKTRVVARSQQLVRIDDEDDADLSPADATRILERVSQALDGADALVLEDYNKGVLMPAVIGGAIREARRRRVPVIVDPKYRHFFAYQGATVFKPNSSIQRPFRRRSPVWVWTTCCSRSVNAAWCWRRGTARSDRLRPWRARSTTLSAPATRSRRTWLSCSAPGDRRRKRRS
jgi:D-glycero-beta-D-manno-heptose-7-phosphate kinase